MPDEPKPNAPIAGVPNPPAKPTAGPVKPDAKADSKADAAPDDDPYAGTPYTGPSEITPGGAYMRGVKIVRGKHMGGEIVNAHGEQLAWFKATEENTGDPADGHAPGEDEDR